MSLIAYLTRIHFAEGVLDDALGAEMARLGATRPFALLDAAGRSHEGQTLLSDALPPRCAPVWAFDLGIDPSSETVEPTSLLRRARHAAQAEACDLLLAFGGPRALGFARRLAGKGGLALPLIAIPTTTADIGLPSGLTAAYASDTPSVVPTTILCDPTLTHQMAPGPTAAHGFDALSHCIEAFLAPGYNPPADGIALEGIHRVARHLEEAVADGRRPVARREVMAAALNGALAAQKGLGGVEALSHALEAECGSGVPHGRLHASVLPRVLRFNAPAVGDKYTRIAASMSGHPSADPIEILSGFAARIGLPDRIGHLGFDPAALQRVARNAAADPATQTNPRHATKDDYLGLLTQSL